MRLERQFAVADDQVGDARGEFEDGRKAAQDLIERVELRVDHLDQGGAVGGVLDQRAGRVAMAAAQAFADGQCAGAVACGGCRGSAQQLVSDLGHGADDDYGLLAEGYASGHDGRGAADGGRVLDRGAAKLHHYQAHANLPIATCVAQPRFSCPDWPAVRR